MTNEMHFKIEAEMEALDNNNEGRGGHGLAGVTIEEVRLKWIQTNSRNLNSLHFQADEDNDEVIPLLGTATRTLVVRNDSIYATFLQSARKYGNNAPFFVVTDNVLHSHGNAH